MHWLLRASIVLNILLSATLSGMFAMHIEDAYPSGADADITISSSDNGGRSDLASIAVDHKVALAQVTHASEAGQPHRVITVLNEDASELAGDALAIGRDYPNYGFNSATVVEPGSDETRSPLGRWIVYGDESDIRDFVPDLINSGFGVSSADMVTPERLVREYFSDPLWILQLAGLATVFVAALVSASASTRIRAVEAAHGQPIAATVWREIARYSAFTFTIAVVSWALWWLLGVIAWNGNQTFEFAGMVFITATIPVLVSSMFACAFAVTLAAILVPNLLDQIKGRRPLRLIYWSAASTLLVTLIGTFIGLGFTQSSASQAATARANAEHLLTVPDAFTVSLWYSEESEVQKALPAWRGFINESAESGLVLLSSYQTQCSLIATSRPCLIVNPEAAATIGIPIEDSVTPDHVQLYAPTTDASEIEVLKTGIEERLSFERQLDERSGVSAPQQESSVEASTLPEPMSIDLLSTTSDSQSRISSAETVIIIASASAFSADTHYSWTSSGAEMFMFDNVESLIERLEQHGAGDLVAWVEQPRDAAIAQIAESNLALTQFATTSVITLFGAFVVGILLAVVYCERRRQPLFVQHIHGAARYQKYGAYFALLGVVSAVALLVNQGDNPSAWAIRVGVVMLLTFAGAGALLIRDHTLRADTIKRP